jgi:hypothetical protein
MCAMRTASFISLLFVPLALGLTACSSDAPAPADSAAGSSAVPASASASGGNGSELAAAGGKVIEVNGAEAKVVCPDFKGQGSAGASIGRSGDTVDCQATVTPADGPGYKTSIRVTWNDDQGHFTTAEQDD